MSTWLIVVVAVVAVGILAGRKTIGRVFGAGKAQLNKAGRVIYGYDQVDEATEEIRQGSRGLVEYQGIVARFRRAVEGGEKEVAVWDVRARGYITQGNDTEAAKALTNKRAVEEKLATDRSSLAKYEGLYDAAKTKVKFAQAKIDEAKVKAQKLKAELQTSQAEAELGKLVQGLNVGTSSLNKLSEAEEEIQRQIDKNRAEATVAVDLGGDGIAQMQAEEAARTAAAADDLAALKASMGK